MRILIAHATYDASITPWSSIIAARLENSRYLLPSLRLFLFSSDDLNVLISSSSSYFSIMIEDVMIRLERRDIYRIFVRFEFYLSKKRKLGNRAYQFSAREKMAALSYPSRYLTPFWNSARAEINRERNVSRKIRDVTRTRSTVFPCFVFELEQGLCLWVILFRIERASERPRCATITRFAGCNPTRCAYV